MTFVVYLPWVNACVNSIFNVKVLVSAFDQEEAFLGAFFMKSSQTFV